MVEKYFLVRHGETEWNREGRVQGSTDVPLSDAGRQQVRTLVSALERGGASVIWSSPQARAWETATILASYLKIPVRGDEDLREIACGEWEGKVFAEVMGADRARFEAWMGDPREPAPGGESFASVQDRVRSALARMGNGAEKGTRFIVVSHAASIRAVAAELLALPILTVTRFALDAASLSILTHWPERSQYRLERWNVKTC